MKCICDRYHWMFRLQRGRQIQTVRDNWKCICICNWQRCCVLFNHKPNQVVCPDIHFTSSECTLSVFAISHLLSLVWRNSLICLFTVHWSWWPGSKALRQMLLKKITLFSAITLIDRLISSRESLLDRFPYYIDWLDACIYTDRAYLACSRDSADCSHISTLVVLPPTFPDGFCF